MTIPATIFVDVNISLTGAAADRFSFGTLLGAFSHSASANRSDGPYFDMAGVNDAGFDSVAEPEVNAWATSVFSQGTGVDSLLVGRIDVGDASMTAALDAIEEETGADGFYLLNTETRLKADILLAAAWAETRTKLHLPQSSDADLLTGAGGDLAEDLAALGYHRTGLIYHRYDDAAAGDVPSDGYLDGGWSSKCGGLDLDAPNGAGVWAFHELSGVTYDPISGTEALALYANDANAYGRTKGLSFTSKGTAASGRFLDVTTTLDWMSERLQEEILSLFVSVPTKVAYTSGGMNQIHAASQSVADRGVTYGHLSPDVPVIFTLPKIETVSVADKLARAVTLTATATLAGAIQRVVYNITVTP